jgi:hypothetical protein
MSDLPAWAGKPRDNAGRPEPRAAARYLLDRVFGRVKEQLAPPADDVSQPYTDEDAEVDAASADFSRLMRAPLVTDH